MPPATSLGCFFQIKLSSPCVYTLLENGRSWNASLSNDYIMAETVTQQEAAQPASDGEEPSSYTIRPTFERK